MTLGARAAVDVDFGRVEVEFPNCQHRHHGKCFVYFKQIHVVFAPPNLVQERFDSSYWSNSKFGRM